MTPPATPILLVGAGPTGLFLGIELARRRVPFRLIDRHPRPLGWDRATVVKSRTLEVFDNVCSADAFIQRGRIVSTVALFSEGVQVAAVEFGGLDSPFPFMLSLPESETESILTDKLRQLGGDVERGLELTGLEQDEHGVRAHIRRVGNGDTHIQEAGWVVGTDGLHSAVRDAVGDQFEGHDNPKLWAVVDSHLHGWRHSRNAIAAQLQPPAVNPIPLGDGRWRIYFRPQSREPGVLARVEEGLAAMSPGARLGDHDEPQFFHTHSRVARRYRIGRVLLAGDAAHACSPIQGHGMNVGIQDAHNLGWKLALVVKGEAAPALLESYEAERRPVAQAVVRSGDEAEERFAGQGPEAVRTVVADLATAEGRLRAAIADAEITHGYDESPIVGDDDLALDPAEGAVRLGHRVGDVERLDRQRGACRLHELLRSPAHAAFVMPGAADAASTEDGLKLATAVAERYRPHVVAYAVTRSTPDRGGGELIGDPTGALHRRLGADRPTLCLVRPDGHLSFRSQPPSLDRLRAHLERILLSG